MRSLPVAIGAVLLALGASAVPPSFAGEPRTVISIAPAASYAARARIVESGRVVLLERPLPYYYRHYPEHSPGYPKVLSGVVVPVFSSSGSVIHRRPVVVASPSAHVAWCRAHYRSYRVGDDSFQPFRGPRRPCRSPYG